jgi:hypothetical protein
MCVSDRYARSPYPRSKQACDCAGRSSFLCATTPSPPCHGASTQAVVPNGVYRPPAKRITRQDRDRVRLLTWFAIATLPAVLQPARNPRPATTPPRHLVGRATRAAVQSIRSSASASSVGGTSSPSNRGGYRIRSINSTPHPNRTKPNASRANSTKYPQVSFMKSPARRLRSQPWTWRSLWASSDLLASESRQRSSASRRAQSAIRSMRRRTLR